MNARCIIRLRFSKLGKVRFTSHRDVARIWERALRRVQVPVAYSEGFSPRPKLSFGLALPTGYESLGEYLDVELAEGVDADVEVLPARLDPALPVGFHVQGAAEVETGSASLQQAVVSCTWHLTVTGVGPARAAELVERALGADRLMVTRSRKGHEVTDDLRPSILSLHVTGSSADGVGLEAELATQPRGVRPSELLAAVGGGLEEGLVCRTHQWMLRDGEPQEPIPLLPAPSAPHAEARAS